MKRPLALITLAFCLGICISSKIRLPFLWVYIMAALLALLCAFSVKKEMSFCILLFFLSFLLGALRLADSFALPQNHILKFLPYKATVVYVEGIIVSDPANQAQKTSFLFKVEKLKIGSYWQEACGKILVKISGRRGFFYGDRLILSGRLFKANYRNYLRRKGVYVILSLGKYDMARKIVSGQGNPVARFVFKIRRHLKSIISQNLSGLSGSIVNAVLLGLRQDLPHQVKAMLVNTGTVHIIAISGLHLGIVAFIALIFLKILRLPAKSRYIITIFILFIYCILTGANIPVIRATLMATILLSGYAMDRQPDICNSLCLAALVMLFINPLQIFEVSFQLSFLSIFSLAWLSPKINLLFPVKLKTSRCLGIITRLFACSLSVWLGLLPLTAYYFRVVSPVAVLANMLVVPYMTLVIACGFIFLLVGSIMPPLVYLFSPAVEVSILFLLKFISFLNRVPFAYFRLS